MASAEAAAAAMQSAARALRELATVPSVASAEASRSISGLIQHEFDTSTDPYGRAWKPLKASTIRRKGHATINVDTTDLRRGIDVRPMSGAGIQITVDASYAPYVQLVRPILPNRGLPRSWASAIADATSNAKRRWAERAGAGAPIIDSVDAMLELAQLLDSAAE